MARLEVPMRARSDRSSESSLDALSRTLESLEARLSRIPGRADAPRVAADRDPMAAPSSASTPEKARARPRVLAEAVSEIVMRRQMLDALGGEAPASPRAAVPQGATETAADPAAEAGLLLRRMQALAAQAQTLNGDDAGLRAMTEIAGELQKLREDVQKGAAQASFEKGFDELRNSFEQLRQMIGGRESAEAIGEELQGISAALAQLTDAGADRSILNAMRSELEELKHLFRKSAQEATVRAVGERWQSFEDTYAARSEEDVAARVELKQELERLRESLRSLAREDQMEAVGRRWDAFEKRQGAANGGDKAVSKAIRDELGALRAKLEALADESPMKAVEARWAELEKRLDPRQIEQSVHALADRMGDIEVRLAAFTGNIDVSTLEARIRTLAEGIDALARRSEQADMQNFLSLEERLDEISRAIVATATPPVFDMTPIERLEARIAALTTRVDAMGGEVEVENLAKRISELSARVEELAENPLGGAMAQRMQALADRFEIAFAEFETPRAVDTGAIEARIDRLAERFDFVVAEMEASKPASGAIEARLSALAAKLEASVSEERVDATLVRALETQIGRLSDGVLRVGASQEALESDIGNRLGAIERQLDEHRDALIQAARDVAEETAKRMQAIGDQRQAEHVARLSDSLKALEALSRNDDGQSKAVFDAVHTTLLKVVDRLERMEEDIASGNRRPVPAPAVPENRPAAAMPAMPPASEKLDERLAEPARDARALDRRQEEAAAPAVDPADMIDRSERNRPLEPGSGMPDIGALLERVRAAQRSRTEAMPEPAAEAETRAVARSAAKAASLEADRLRASSGKPEGQGGFKGLIARRRKAIITGVVAVIVALSALPIGNALMSRRAAEEGFEPVAAVAPPVTDAAQATAPAPDALVSPPQAEASAAVPAQPVEAPPALAGDTLVPPPAAPAQVPAPVSTVAPPDAASPLAEALAKLPASAKARPTAPDGIGPASLVDAAAAGDPKAAFEIGLRLLEGRTGEPQPSAALPWFVEAAGKGYVPAQYSLGTLFEKGSGVARDTIAARDWYTLAAESGNVRAMHNLAVLYATGIDGRSQPEVAAKWFIQAADHGMRDSQYNLGILYARGSGVRQDLAASYKWFGVVADAGDSDAAAKRDEIGKSLSPDELRAANEAVKTFAPAPRIEIANTVDTPVEWQGVKDQTSSVDMTKAIRNIQAILGRLGYDAGAPDGKLGEKTKVAITAFQKDNDMPATGGIDGPLIRALLQKKDTKPGA